MRTLPPHVCALRHRAERLEWWSIGWTASVIAVMGAAMGSSQAMKTAWIEDCLSGARGGLIMSASCRHHDPAAERGSKTGT